MRLVLYRLGISLSCVTHCGSLTDITVVFSFGKVNTIWHGTESIFEIFDNIQYVYYNMHFYNNYYNVLSIAKRNIISFGTFGMVQE